MKYEICLTNSWIILLQWQYGKGIPLAGQINYPPFPIQVMSQNLILILIQCSLLTRIFFKKTNTMICVSIHDPDNQQQMNPYLQSVTEAKNSCSGKVFFRVREKLSQESFCIFELSHLWSFFKYQPNSSETRNHIKTFNSKFPMQRSS